MRRLPRSWWGRVLLAIAAVIVILVVTLVGSTAWLDAFGAAPKGERLARIQRSPNYRDGAFRNPDATSLATKGSTRQTIRKWLGGDRRRADTDRPRVGATRVAVLADRPQVIPRVSARARRRLVRLLSPQLPRAISRAAESPIAITRYGIMVHRGAKASRLS